MKRLISWLPPAALTLAGWLLGFSGLNAGAQTPAVAEYRIDGGVSQTMTLGTTATNLTRYWEGEFTAAASAAGLSVGPHYLEVRAQGSNGTWSAWQGQWFRVSGETHLVGAEWFVDTDPGPGLGTPIPLPADGAWDEPEEDIVVAGIQVTNLAVGRHQLIIRAKDSNGDWGITSQTTFYVAPAVTIAAAVWTTNLMDFGDPSLTPPATNQMRATDGAFDEDAEDVIATVNTLALGTNFCMDRTIYVRCQDSLGRWSTRGGLVWNAGSKTWTFNPAAGWQTNWVPLVVAPEVASSGVPGLGNLVINSNNSVVLDWNDCQGVKGYAVYFRASPTVPLALLATGLTNSTFTVSNLPASGQAQWLVRSLGDTGCGYDGPLWSFGFHPPLASDDVDRDGISDTWERYFFGSLAAVNATTDRDSDAFKDWKECITGTVPTNRVEFFKIANCRPGPVNPWLGLPSTIFEWQSVTGRTYTIYYSTAAQPGANVWMVLDQLQGTGGTMCYTNEWPDPVVFYMLDVSMPSGP
jgi:hypothetical protein